MLEEDRAGVCSSIICSVRIRLSRGDVMWDASILPYAEAVQCNSAKCCCSLPVKLSLEFLFKV